MDLIPKPSQLASATANLAHALVYGGVADLRPMPRTLIDDGPRREVYHYRPQRTVQASGDPVLLVTPLAAPSSCYDLRRGCSLVEHLVQEGRATYLVEYGRISFKDRALGMEHWIEEVVPEAVRAASRHAGGRPVHVVGWSLGGIFAVLAAARAAGPGEELPIASLTVVGSPVDVSKVPLIAPLRPVLGLDAGLATRLYRAIGGAPPAFVKTAFQLSSLQSWLTKPYAQLVNLDDTEFLAQLEAVGQFTDQMSAYPGRTFGQLYHRMIRGNALVDGIFELGDVEIRLADVRVPVLVLAGNTDGIAPINAVQPLSRLLSGSDEVRFEIVPGGHLGMLSGRAGQEHDVGGARRVVRRAGRTGSPGPEGGREEDGGQEEPGEEETKKASKKTAKKTTAKKTATRRSTGSRARRTPRDPRAIGANPERTYGSAASRRLAGS